VPATLGRTVTPLLPGERVVVWGAGPAGLTAAYLLARKGFAVTVLESDDIVGGISRTAQYKGFRFDIGGHRFFTKIEPVQALWEEILGDEFLDVPRLSRIHYNGIYFDYPLKATNALRGLGLMNAFKIVFSYAQSRLHPYPVEETFEQWVSNRFGKRLYEIFFKTYTEKVWGIPCSELKAEWAAQRIKDLSLRSAIIGMLVKPKRTVRSLIEEFHYPRLGPGMLWAKVKEGIEDRRGEVRLNSPVVRARLAGDRIDHVVIRNARGEEETVAGDPFISSMPISDFIQMLDPVPGDVLEAAKRLNYRDFLTVCLVVDGEELFPDNWIYVHSPDVKVGRIQNYKNWSPDMVPDRSRTSLGLEYFCTEGDELWTMADADLIELAKVELERINLASADAVVDGVVYRVPKAYPIYDADYRDSLDVVRSFVDSLSNFQTIGRNGLHRYNNQDHSMVTAMLAVRNLMLDEENDVWAVNTTPEYHEEVADEVDEREVTPALEDALVRIFSRLDPIAFGLASGAVAGASLLLASLSLLVTRGGIVGTHWELLGGPLPGVTATTGGVLVGLLYVAGIGFLLGAAAAYLRNLMVGLTARLVHRDVQFRLLRRLFEVS
jgi:protoporphyrinogen oxidase